MSKYEEQFEKETQQTLGCTNEYIDWLESHLSQAEEKIKQNEWISIEDQLPKHDKPVLAFYKDNDKDKIIRAKYIERWKEFSIGEDCYDEYSEELDEYYLKKGWYECLENWDEYESFFISKSITHWMLLPESPK
jgi:hypothetical protein